MVDAVKDGFAVGDQCGQDQRGGGAEVRAHDGGADERRFAADGGGAAVDLDVRAHADQFLNVHEAVLEDVLGDGADVPSAWVARAMYCACMSVGKPGYSSVVMSAALSGLSPRTRTRIRRCRRLRRRHCSSLAIGRRGGGIAAVDVEIASGDGSGDEEGAGFDAVGIDAVARAVESGDALDADGAGAGAFDFRSHGGEQGGEVGDFRLARAVFEDGFAIGEDGGHEEVFGAGDGDLVEDDVRAFEAAVVRGLRGSRGPG